MSIWDKYEKGEIIGYGTYGNIYKAQNKKTGNLVAIKEILKKKNKQYLNEIDVMNRINNENSILLIETFNTKDFFYIIMELCICNLEEYINMRNKGLSINEIKEVLTQINNTLKLMKNQNLIHRDLKPSNILISLIRIDKCIFKLSDYGTSKLISNTMSYTGTPLTMAPEILNDGKDLSKSDLWSLGITIYFMYFKEYPYFGKNDHMLFNDINSKKKLKAINNEELNDLMNKLLIINIDKRLSWDDYFNHSFFINKEIENVPFFDFNCKKHFQENNYYCKNCKINICDNCLKEHNNHQVISFYDIGLNQNEINIFQKLFKDIENNLNSLNKMKNDIQSFVNKIKLINKNISVYEDNSTNNYKNYYIDYLKFINEKLKINEIKIIELKKENNSNNYIICEYEIKENRILNSHDEACREDKWFYKGINNEKEIKDNCEIYINEKKFDFCYKDKKKGNDTIKIICNKLLTNSNYMFYKCSSLTSLDLSNLKSNQIVNMSWMFFGCVSLINLNLSNLNTKNVNDMNHMFTDCSSLTSLNLLNLNTNNVKDMNYMFSNCSSLLSLNLSNFDTKKVKNMSGMFSNCSSLLSLNLSNFNTKKVKNMSGMFSNCSSLISLDLSNFNTINVTNMYSMISQCFSLISLNLSNFDTNNVIDMKEMFYNLNKNCKIISNDKKINELTTLLVY